MYLHVQRTCIACLSFRSIYFIFFSLFNVFFFKFYLTPPFSLLKLFQDASSGSRPTSYKFIILLYDGLSTDRQNVYKTAEKLRNARIKLISIGIGSSVSHMELVNIAYNEEYVFTYEQYEYAVNRLMVSTVAKSCPGLYLSIKHISFIFLESFC